MRKWVHWLKNSTLDHTEIAWNCLIFIYMKVCYIHQFNMWTNSLIVSLSRIVSCSTVSWLSSPCWMSLFPRWTSVWTCLKYMHWTSCAACSGRRLWQARRRHTSHGQRNTPYSDSPLLCGPWETVQRSCSVSQTLKLFLVVIALTLYDN